MKKKIIIYSVFLSLVSIMAFNTLAYFTSREDVTNIITTGYIELEIVEVGFDVKEFPLEGIDRITPGSEVVKNVSILNSGRNPMWLRVKAVKNFTDNEELDRDIAFINFNLDDWTFDGGWYYYNAELLPDEFTTELFSKVLFDAERMDNSYQNQTFTIDVIAEAVQSQNNGLSAVLAAGWED